MKNGRTWSKRHGKTMAKPLNKVLNRYKKVMKNMKRDEKQVEHVLAELGKLFSTEPRAGLET